MKNGNIIQNEVTFKDEEKWTVVEIHNFDITNEKFAEVRKWSEEVEFAQDAYNQLMEAERNHRNEDVILVVRRLMFVTGMFYSELEKLDETEQAYFWR